MNQRTKPFGLLKARDMITAAEEMLDGCGNKDAFEKQLEAAMELEAKAESFRQLAAEMDAVGQSLQDQCSDYVEQHPSVLTEQPRELPNGASTASTILGRFKYVVVWTRDKIRRQMAANFTEEFLADLPKALVKSRLVLNTGAAVKLDDKELAKLGLRRSKIAYWRRELARQEVGE